MAGETLLTIVGNLTDDPELRFTPSGAAVCSFKIASTPRVFDRNTNAWVDQDTLFLRCSVWRQTAENVAESLQRGTRVIVQGRLKSRTFDTKEGDKRTVLEVDVEEVGPSLRNATAKVTRTQRQGGDASSQSRGGWGGGQQQGRPSAGAPQDDSWASAPAGGGWGAAAGGPGGGYSEEPPF